MRKSGQDGAWQVARSPVGPPIGWKSVATPRLPFMSARLVPWISTRLSMRGATCACEGGTGDGGKGYE